MHGTRMQCCWCLLVASLPPSLFPQHQTEIRRLTRRASMAENARSSRREQEDASVPSLYVHARSTVTSQSTSERTTTIEERVSADERTNGRVLLLHHSSSSQHIASNVDDARSLPLLPPPVPLTPPIVRRNSNSSSSNKHRQQKSSFRVVSGSGGGSSSVSPHVAILENPPVPGSAAFAMALGNIPPSSDEVASDASGAVDDNSRNTATMLSDSQWEREIAEFGRILDDMLTRVTCRELVKKTAEYMKEHPQHSIRFQIKIKQVMEKLCSLCVHTAVYLYCNNNNGRKCVCV